MINEIIGMAKFQFFLANFVSMIPLIIYIAYFDKKDNGNWLGATGTFTIKLLRKLQWRT